MPGAQVEYVGFQASGAGREYTLLVRPGAGEEPIQFTLEILNEAFTSGRLRYQDAPELCFRKLQRELVACAEGLPKRRLIVADADLEEYRAAHAPPQRGPRPS